MINIDECRYQRPHRSQQSSIHLIFSAEISRSRRHSLFVGYYAKHTPTLLHEERETLCTARDFEDSESDMESAPTPVAPRLMKMFI